MSGLREGQIRWRGQLLFDGRDLALTELEGWDDLPEIETGNVERAARHGAWPGAALAGQRLVTAVGVLTGAGSLTDVRTVLRPLRRALTLTDGARQHPLEICVGGESLTAHAQVTARVIPGGPAFRSARPIVTVQWTCADPRRYGNDRQNTVNPPRPSEDGLEYPLEYPLDHGQPAHGGGANLLNDGDSPTHPVVEVAGPCSRPRLINRTTGTNLEFGLTLAGSDRLVVDCDQGTVLLNGVDGFHHIAPASVPPEHWTLAPGTNPVHFRPQTSEPEAWARFRWRDAYL
ncbi:MULTISPECIES: phage distal tail protein [Nocardiopsis]|uniref:phage distal tail protein n=1 Tax=Nocardiopsis TaxID=2013 RepID=UPI00037858DD|nr:MULTISPECIES: phage tail domain-containing protein [Nocardiopsis]PWV51263.1 tail protein [Nocardiopsis sp. L17-MgMaSL7]